MYSHSLCPQKCRNKMCGLDSLTDLLLRTAAGPCHLYHNHQWPWVLAVVLDISYFPSQTSIVTSCKALDLIHKIIAQTSSLWRVKQPFCFAFSFHLKMYTGGLESMAYREFFFLIPQSYLSLKESKCVILYLEWSNFLGKGNEPADFKLRFILCL